MGARFPSITILALRRWSLRLPPVRVRPGWIPSSGMRMVAGYWPLRLSVRETGGHVLWAARVRQLSEELAGRGLLAARRRESAGPLQVATKAVPSGNQPRVRGLRSSADACREGQP